MALLMLFRLRVCLMVVLNVSAATGKRKDVISTVMIFLFLDLTPRKYYAPIQSVNPSTLLTFDCVRRLLEKGVPPTHITHLFLTHLHYDH